MSQSPRPRPLGLRAPLLGFDAPAALEEKGAHGPPVAWSSTPVFRGLLRSDRDCVGGSHPAGYGAAHRFSQPRSGFSLPPPSCHFQAGGALGVWPYRGLFLPRSPDGSSPPVCPLGVVPFGWPSPRPRWGNLRAHRTFPRFRPVPIVAFRAFVRVGVGRSRQDTVSIQAIDLPLLGFRLPMA
jgi:hypothetical protein